LIDFYIRQGNFLQFWAGAYSGWVAVQNAPFLGNYFNFLGFYKKLHKKINHYNNSSLTPKFSPIARKNVCKNNSVMYLSFSYNKQIWQAFNCHEMESICHLAHTHTLMVTHITLEVPKRNQMAIVWYCVSFLLLLVCIFAALWNTLINMNVEWN